jgi:C-terminal processing protease CtpA/Prc
MGEGIDALVSLGEYSGGTAVDTTLAGQPSPNVGLGVALDLARRPVVVSPQRTHSTPPAPAAPRPLPTNRYPAAPYRVLAAYKWWNAIHYFFPYKHPIGENWSDVLPLGIARLEGARDSLDYALGIAELAVRIRDSHGFLNSSTLSAYFGMASAGVQLQYIAGEPVVVSIAEDSATKASGIAVGDVIVQVDGEKAAARKERFSRYIAHSTPQSLDALVAQRLLLGPEGSARITIRDRNNRVQELTLPRRAALTALLRYPRAGPAMLMLPGNIGYADLSRLTVPMVDSMFELFKNTKGIILDDRGYPQGTAWAIAPRLTDKRAVPAAQFQRPLVISPDSSQWTNQGFVQYIPTPTKWRYTGKTVLLVDERTISQAEHTGLFFEAANNTTIIGSPTMGANGDVTSVNLPGGVIAYFTGHDVRHADGRQLQRVGLKPDIVVRPTLAGIRAGRDEVLSRAIEFLNGSKPRAAR